MNLNARLEQIEKKTRYRHFSPAIFAHSQDELEQQRHKIGPQTVVFLYDWGEDVELDCGAVIIDNIPTDGAE